MNFHNVNFLISAAHTRQFPPRDFPEIAFAGKSNVGKSSVINRILNRKNFARVGQKAGKTIHINYFAVDKKAYFVDDVEGFADAILRMYRRLDDIDESAVRQVAKQFDSDVIADRAISIYKRVIK